MSHVLAIASRELPHAWRRMAPSPWAGALNLLCIALVCWLVPWLIGLSLLDPLVIVPFACLSAFFTGIAVPPMFSGRNAHVHIRSLTANGRSTPEVITGKVLAGLVPAWMIGTAVLTATLTVLNVMNWHGSALLPDPPIMIVALLASAAVSTFTGVWSILVATGAKGPKDAQRAMRHRLMLATLALVFVPGFIPSSWTAWFSAGLTNAGVTRQTVIGSAAVFALAFALGRLAVLRVDQWSATPPSPNTY